MNQFARKGHSTAVIATILAASLAGRSSAVAPLNGTDLTTHVRPDGKVETYYAAGDTYLVKAFELLVSFWNQWASDANLHLSRGHLDAYLPLQLQQMGHEPANDMQRRIGEYIWTQRNAVTGLVPFSYAYEDPYNPGVWSTDKQHLRFPFFATELLRWFPDDAIYRSNASELCAASRQYFDFPGGGVYPWVDVTTGTPAGETSYINFIGPVVYAMAQLAALTGDVAATDWADQKVDFWWSVRPEMLPILPDRFTTTGVLTPEPASTDSLYYSRNLFLMWNTLKGKQQFRNSANKYLSYALAMTDQWYSTGWMPEFGHFTTHINYADGSPAETQLRSDSKWNTLYVLVWAFRATGDKAYLDRLRVAWENLRERSQNGLGLIDETFDSGYGNGEPELYQILFVDLLIDAYEASHDPYFLSEAMAHADRILSGGDAWLPNNAATAVSTAMLRLALAASRVWRLTAIFGEMNSPLEIFHGTTRVFSVAVPGEIAVVYLPEGRYKVKVGNEQKTVWLHKNQTLKMK